MKQAVIREIMRVDANHQLHISVPAEMGKEFEVIVLPVSSKAETDLRCEEQFMLASYTAAIESDSEEDALWGKYVHS